ncbi:MAG: hypothetical protein JWO60_110 [Frankiales bacterium]|nr:hypothetical protein [Frankiales bacterium]
MSALLLFVAATAAAMTVYIVIAPNFDPSLRYSSSWIMAGLLTAILSVGAGLTGRGLLRRRPKARAIAMMLSVALVGFAAWLVLNALVLSPSEHGSEVVYSIMGALLLLAGGIAATTVLGGASSKGFFEGPGGARQVQPPEA